MAKQPIDTLVHYRSDGHFVPVYALLPDLGRCHVDKVMDERMAASTKAGGYGTRFLCRLSDREGHAFTMYIFYEGPRWFIEVDAPPGKDSQLCADDLPF